MEPALRKWTTQFYLVKKLNAQYESNYTYSFTLIVFVIFADGANSFAAGRF